MPPYFPASCGRVLRADRPHITAMASRYQKKIASFRSDGTLVPGAALHAPQPCKASQKSILGVGIESGTRSRPDEARAANNSAGKIRRRLRQCHTYHRRTSHYVHRHESAILISVEHLNKKERRISCKKGIGHATVPRF